MKNTILAILGRLQKAEEAILAAAILGIALLTIANVFSRMLLGDSLALAEEVSQFLIIAVTFVGLSYAASHGRHIRMTAISEQLPLDWQYRLATAVQLATSLLMFILAAFAGKYVYGVYQLGGIYPVTRIPFFVVYLLAPLGFLLAGCQYFLSVLSGDYQFVRQPSTEAKHHERGAGA